MTAKEALESIMLRAKEGRNKEQQKYIESNYELVKQALTEQEKKNKLLELYKKLHDTYRYPTWKCEKDVQCVLEEIKSLEEELK